MSAPTIEADVSTIASGSSVSIQPASGEGFKVTNVFFSNNSMNVVGTDGTNNYHTITGSAWPVGVPASGNQNSLRRHFATPTYYFLIDNTLSSEQKYTLGYDVVSSGRQGSIFADAANISGGATYTVQPPSGEKWRVGQAIGGQDFPWGRTDGTTTLRRKPDGSIEGWIGETLVTDGVVNGVDTLEITNSVYLTVKNDRSNSHPVFIGGVKVIV